MTNKPPAIKRKIDRECSMLLGIWRVLVRNTGRSPSAEVRKKYSLACTRVNATRKRGPDGRWLKTSKQK
jgi:hypothetical protein